MSHISLGVAFLVSMALATPAAAGSLATPLLLVKTGEVLTCQIANIGAKTVRAVRSDLIHFVGTAGTVEDSTGPADLAPLALSGVGTPVLSGVQTYVCRFEFSGSGKGLRANALVNTGDFEVLDTQPAR
jgi:hypothetical protein